SIDDLDAVAREGVQARERELGACHQIIEEHVAALIEKLNAEDERLSAEERNNRWVPDPLATPSNLLPTAAEGVCTVSMRLINLQVVLAIEVANARNDPPPTGDRPWSPPTLTNTDPSLA